MLVFHGAISLLFFKPKDLGIFSCCRAFSASYAAAWRYSRAKGSKGNPHNITKEAVFRET